MTQSPQESLFYDTPNDALGAAITAAGGFKKVACTLWPSMKAESAYARLKACLDENKPEKLTPDEIVGIARMAREEGSHAVMQYLATELGYEIRPLEPRDELASLYAQYVESARVLAKLHERIARAETRAQLKAV